MYDVEDVDDTFVLENFKQFCYLCGGICIHASLRHRYLLIQFDQCVANHCMNHLELEISIYSCSAIDLGTYKR